MKRKLKHTLQDQAPSIDWPPILKEITDYLASTTGVLVVVIEKLNLTQQIGNNNKSYVATQTGNNNALDSEYISTTITSK